MPDESLGAGEPGAEQLLEERRRFERVLLKFPVEYTVRGKGPLALDGTGETWNLSRSGVGIYLDEAYPKGTILDLRLRVPGATGPVELRGQIAWNGEPEEKRFPTGVQLTEVLQDDGSLVSHCLIRQFGL